MSDTTDTFEYEHIAPRIFDVAPDATFDCDGEDLTRTFACTGYDYDTANITWVAQVTDTLVITLHVPHSYYPTQVSWRVSIDLARAEDHGPYFLVLKDKFAAPQAAYTAALVACQQVLGSYRNIFLGAPRKPGAQPDVTVVCRGCEYVFNHAVGRYNEDDDNWDNEDLRVILACEDGRWDAVLMDGPLASAASEGVVAVLNDYTTAQGAFDALIARSRRLYAHTHQLRVQLRVRLPDVEDRK